MNTLARTTPPLARSTGGIPNLKINVVDSPDKVSEFWEWLTSHHDFIAADTETTGLDWWYSGFRVRLFQFGDSTSGWAIPFQGWRDLVLGALRWLFDRRVKVVFHNLAFDYQAMLSEGFRMDLSVCEDTFVWASLLGFAEDSRALKTIAAREFGNWTKFGQALLARGMANAGWDWATVPMDYKPYVIYGAIDPIITAMYYERLRDRGMAQFAWNHSLEVATIDLTGTMMRNGLAVDTIYCAEQIEILDAKEAEILAKLKSQGISSAFQNAAVAKVLQDAGIPQELIKLTGSGQVSVDKEFLESVKHPVARQVLDARRINKTRSYLVSMLKNAGGTLGHHELIHPEIRSIEARTGRMSVANPALQQLPSPDEDDPDTMIVRRAVVPREEGHVLVGADYGQIELRVFAALTQDDNLRAVLNKADAAKAAGDVDNGDFFTALGRDVYHEPDFKKSDFRRRLLKATVYATLYSAGEEKIAETAKVTTQAIHSVLEALKSRYTAFETLGQELIKPGGRGPYGEPINSVSTPTGRRFAVAHNSERRKLMNYLVQGHSAEILKMALQNVREAGYEDNLVLPVHDEIIMSVPEAEAARATAELVECMDAVVDFNSYGVGVRASAANAAKSWAGMEH